MRKTLLLLVLLLITAVGCTTGTTSYHASKSLSSMTRYANGATGILYLAALVETQSNFSSLLFDKTEAKKSQAYEMGYAKLGKDAIFHVLPVKVTTPSKIHYDKGTQTILKNYIALNKFGNVTRNSTENDFFVVTHINESLESRFGENSSTIEITIIDRENMPYFHTQVTMISQSDKNFWYYPTKDAKPVSYLTMKGVNYLLTSSLMKAFQES